MVGRDGTQAVPYGMDEKPFRFIELLTKVDKYFA